MKLVFLVSCLTTITCWASEPLAGLGAQATTPYDDCVADSAWRPVYALEIGSAGQDAMFAIRASYYLRYTKFSSPLNGPGGIAMLYMAHDALDLSSITTNERALSIERCTSKEITGIYASGGGL